MILLRQRQRSLDDLRCGAVVDPQKDPARARVIFREVQHDSRACAAKAVDRLVIVPYHEQALTHGRKHFHDLVLHAVYVLKFVDQNETEALPPGPEDFGPVLKQLACPEKHVVIIHRGTFPEKRVVSLVKAL